MLHLNHKKLRAWQLSIELVLLIKELCTYFPDGEKFVLTQQMRRAALSVPNNIAEGASRKSAVERKRFYEISRSSLVELDTDIEICLLLNYVSPPTNYKNRKIDGGNL
ncbi:MAG: four helix bundle protein [Terrimonas sp.]|nr:four helix bundle protein [Terrimonas sp.]